MKITQEKIVYEDCEKFYCIYFDDNTYLCLTEDEYNDLMKIIKNGSQSDLNNFVDKSSTRNLSNTSGGDISNIGMFFSIVLGILMIWIFNKTFQWIPIIISLLIFAGGLVALIDGFVNHKKFHIIYALIYCIGGVIGYFLAMSCLFILISFSHIYLDSAQLDQITKESGLETTAGISFILTIIGSFLWGAYYEYLDSK